MKHHISVSTAIDKKYCFLLSKCGERIPFSNFGFLENVMTRGQMGAVTCAKMIFFFLSG